MQQKQSGLLIVVSMVVFCLLGGSGLWMASVSAQQESTSKGVILQGTVRDQKNPLYGILVKAAAGGKNYLTSVFTDDNGAYIFPPMAPGDYVISIGTKWQEKVRLVSSPVKKDFVVELGPGFFNQTSGSRFIDFLPGTPEDKRRLYTGCSGCHGLWRLIDRQQGSLEGWTKVIHKMQEIGGVEYEKTEDSTPILAKYLASAIKPEMKGQYGVQAMIRPKGDGAKAVFTEWELPQEMGSPTGVQADSKGMLWFTGGGPNAGVGRLDPRTGDYQVWPAPQKPGLHDLVLDKMEENIWLTASTKNKILKFNTKTLQYTIWDVPGEYGKYPLVGDLDPDGNFWFAMRDVPGNDLHAMGWVVKLDGHTGKFTGYQTHFSDPHNYGMVVDQKGAVWFTELNASKIGKVDRQTGDLTEYSTPTPDAGPRRIRVDSKGNLWFTESFASKLGKLDPATMKMTEYDLGVPGGFPYFMAIDKSDQVWFNLVGSNSVGKLDPKTKKITTTLFPVPESGAREPGFDLTAGSPTLVYGALRSAIGRVYFRR